MTASPLRKEVLFYPALFLAWALFLIARYADYRYFDTPFPSAGFERMSGGMSKVSLLRNSLAELQRNLIEENDKTEKPHILQNIGCAYYDLYKETRDPGQLDSALGFIYQSTIEAPTIGRFHYNFGRMFTEQGDQQRAMQQYEQAIRYEPNHILALSNAGTCAYFAFNRSQDAARYFARALAIDSLMPMCNVVLGLISLDEKDYNAALTGFEKELRADAAATVKNRYPLSLENISYAAMLSHSNLTSLYSTKFPNKALAQQHLEEYLKLEPEQTKRDDAVKQFRRCWGK
jgi:tetratricopeptide (TPR) repeat protein